MADKTIGSLPEATELDAESLLVTEQLGQARKVTGELLANYAKEAAEKEAEKAGTYAQNAEESAQVAEEKAQEAQNVATKPPYIQDGNWWIWDEESGDYINSGIDASTSLSIADTITGAPGTYASVENIGTDSDLILRFTIPRGEKGEVGGVNSVNSKEGDVILTAEDVGAIPSSEKGAVSGVATLDTDGKLTQMPTAADVGAVLPNLLLNSDFGINQRGKTSYAAASIIYTYDRWAAYSATITREENTSPAQAAYMAKCVFTTYGTWPNFGQTLENYSEYIGKALTVRFWIKGLAGTSSVTVWVGDTWHEVALNGEWQEVTHTFAPVTNGTQSWSRKGVLFQTAAANPATGTGFYLAAPQVCIGAFAGQYVPPEPVTELMKCQRFYYKTKGNPIYGFTQASNSTTKIVYPYFILPGGLRATPKVTMPENGIMIRGNGKTVYAEEINAVYRRDNEVGMEVTAEAIGDNEAISGRFDTSNHTEFDAEIYS